MYVIELFATCTLLNVDICWKSDLESFKEILKFHIFDDKIWEKGCFMVFYLQSAHIFLKGWEPRKIPR